MKIPSFLKLLSLNTYPSNYEFFFNFEDKNPVKWEIL